MVAGVSIKPLKRPAEEGLNKQATAPHPHRLWLFGLKLTSNVHDIPVLKPQPNSTVLAEKNYARNKLLPHYATVNKSNQENESGTSSPGF